MEDGVSTTCASPVFATVGSPGRRARINNRMVLGCCLAISVIWLWNLIRDSKYGGRVSVQWIDCKGAEPIALSDRASRQFRRSWKGVGDISFGDDRTIPYAAIEVDGIELFWDGNELVRKDFPVSGTSTYWRFRLEEIAGTDVIGRQFSGSEDRVATLIGILEK